MNANWACDSVAKGILKKAFAESSTAWFTPRTVAKASKMVALLGTATWGPYLVEFSVVHGHPPRAICLFFTGHTRLLKALWARYTISTWCSSWIMSAVSLCTPPHPAPGTLYWQLLLFVEVVDLLVDVSPQHWFDYFNPEAEFTNRDLRSLTL